MPSLDDLDPVFQAAGQEWNVDPTLLKAMARQESGGKADAVSKAGARGLMQIMPETGKTLGVTDLNDPVQSIWGAAKYMNQALDKEGSVEGALLNYHGGGGWRQAYGPESRGYVPAVASHYKTLIAAQQPDAVGSQQAPPAAPQTAQAVVPGGDMPIGAPPPSQADIQPTTPPPSSPQATNPLILGDSLASKAGLGGQGVVGASPKAVANSIATLPVDQVKGHDVILSSGASNNPAQASLVYDQIQALKAKGANSVTVVGVGDKPGLEGVNNALATVSGRAGGKFVPLAPNLLSQDRVHPTPTGYKQLRAQLGLG